MASKKLNAIVNELNDIMSKSKKQHPHFENMVKSNIESLVKVKEEVYKIRASMVDEIREIKNLETKRDSIIKDQNAEILKRQNESINKLATKYPVLKGKNSFTTAMGVKCPDNFEGSETEWKKLIRATFKSKEIENSALPKINQKIEDKTNAVTEKFEKDMESIISTLTDIRKGFNSFESTNDREATLAKTAYMYTDYLIKKYNQSDAEIYKLIYADLKARFKITQKVNATDKENRGLDEAIKKLCAENKKDKNS